MNRRTFQKSAGTALLASLQCTLSGKNGLALEIQSRRILAADKGSVAIVDDTGSVQWKYENKAEAHDLHLRKNGNILMPVSRTKIVEVTPDKKIIWTYESKPKAPYKGAIEIHAFQPLPDGRVMVAESGNKRIVEVDADGKVVFEMELTVEKPHPHRDTRLVRRMEHGGYLVCHEGDGKIREYDRSGNVIWTYEMELGGRPRSEGHGPEGHGLEVYSAIRLKNGNTLIGGGNNNRVLEVDKTGNIVWKLDQKELPGITLAWVTTVTALPNGNVIVGNCHAGPGQPQLFEVTRDKKVVWKFMDFNTFGNGLASSQILDLPEGSIR